MQEHAKDSITLVPVNARGIALYCRVDAINTTVVVSLHIRHGRNYEIVVVVVALIVMLSDNVQLERQY